MVGVDFSHSLTAPRYAHIRVRWSFSDSSQFSHIMRLRHWDITVWSAVFSVESVESVYMLRKPLWCPLWPSMMSCSPACPATRHQPLSLLSYLNGTILKTQCQVWLTCLVLESSLSTSRLGSVYKTSPALNGFEGIPAIIVVEQQNIFSLLNGCFCGYWCVFSGMIGSSWTGSWERAADGVPPPLSNHCHKAALQIPIILFSLV